jgi:PhzF family phenazine biosynthesis protein
MRIPIYQVDAFTQRPFAGNPAAVCPLETPLDDDMMQAIAAENNLSETAFFVPRDDEDYDLRWFTPTTEVDLCGHATLATAWVVLHRLRPYLDQTRFHTRSGPLTISRDGQRLVMDFPASPPATCEPPPGLAAALGAPPSAVLRADAHLAVFDDEATVRALTPDMTALSATSAGEGLCATAPGAAGVAGDHDFVSRFFCPLHGIDEDPVTGAAHCMLAPYWAQRLGKLELRARQVSPRGGDVHCRLDGDRVHLSGTAVLVLEGVLELPD